MLFLIAGEFTIISKYNLLNPLQKHNLSEYFKTRMARIKGDEIKDGTLNI